MGRHAQVAVKAVTGAKWWPGEPRFLSTHPRRSRAGTPQRKGELYEEAGHRALLARYGRRYIPSPWLRYSLDGGKWHFCQPDALLFPEKGKKEILVLEYKLTHTGRAFTQLVELYLPVLAKIFPPHLWNLIPVEVTQWFDGSVRLPYPFPPRVVGDLDNIMSRGALNVLTLRPFPRTLQTKKTRKGEKR